MSIKDRKHALVLDKSRKPPALPVVPENIPVALRERRQWVVWRWSWSTKKGKWDKPPRRAHAPLMLASSADPMTWSDFGRAVQTGDVDGIGFALTHDDPFAGIDLDNCRDPDTGIIEQWALKIVSDLNSYTEVSPTGTGLRIFVRAVLAKGRKKANIEVYDRGRYLTTTGRQVSGTPSTIEDRQSQVDALIAGLDAKPTAKATHGKVPHGTALPDHELLEKALKDAKFHRLWNGDASGYSSGSEADLALCGKIAFWTGPDPGRIAEWLSRSGLARGKHERPDYLERTIGKAIEGRTDYYGQRSGARQPVTASGGVGGNETKEVFADEDGDGNGETSAELVQELIDLVATNSDQALPRAVEQKYLSALADVQSTDPALFAAFLLSLTRAKAKTRDVADLKNTIKAERQRQRRETVQKARGECADQAVFQNYREEMLTDENGKPRVLRIGQPIQALADEWFKKAGGWPKVVGNNLFVEGDDKPMLLDNTNALFAWMARHLQGKTSNPLRWASGDDKVTRDQFFACLCQTAESFDAVEVFPHYPPCPNTYYLSRPAVGGKGALRELMALFCPLALIDHDLILAGLLSLVWGGDPGARPAFLIEGDEDDNDKGRASGKTTLIRTWARLVGGHVETSLKEDMETLKTRLLSPAARAMRVVLIDNVKTLRLSHAELESAITSSVISGRQLFVGDGRRANNLLWCFTGNGLSLSKDLAQRCVIIRVKRPDFDPTWEQRAAELIETKRWEIIGDLLAILEGPGQKLPKFSRWSAWESGVLSRVAEPADCQKAIEERQGAIDQDGAESQDVRRAIAEEIGRHQGPSGLLLNPETCYVTFHAKDMVETLEKATGERRPVTRTGVFLGTLSIPELRKSPRKGERLWAWRGEKAPAEATAIDLKRQ